MQTIESLKRRLQTVGELHSVVRSMKALAAASIRQFEESVRALSGYSHTVDLALRAVDAHRRHARGQAAEEDRGQPPGSRVHRHGASRGVQVRRLTTTRVHGAHRHFRDSIRQRAGKMGDEITVRVVLQVTE